MPNVNRGLPSQPAESAIDEDHKALLRGAQAPVSKVYDSALRALSNFMAFIGEPSPSQLSVERVRAAHLRLDKALLRALLEPCCTVSDGRAKCFVFKQLREVFPPEDERLRDFAIQVLLQMSDLLRVIDNQASSDKSAIMCSCGKAVVTHESIRNQARETASGS